VASLAQSCSRPQAGQAAQRFATEARIVRRGLAALDASNASSSRRWIARNDSSSSFWPWHTIRTIWVRVLFQGRLKLQHRGSPGFKAWHRWVGRALLVAIEQYPRSPAFLSFACLFAGAHPRRALHTTTTSAAKSTILLPTRAVRLWRENSGTRAPPLRRAHHAPPLSRQPNLRPLHHRARQQ
jgi:hypothetical protein